MASSLGSFPLDAALPYFRKRFGAVHEFVPVGLLGSHCDFLPQLGKPQLLHLLALFQQPQAFAQNLTLGLVITSFQQLGHKFIEDRPEMDVHAFTIPTLTVIVNY